VGSHVNVCQGLSLSTIFFWILELWYFWFLFIFNVTLVLIIRYYCFSDWFNQVNMICDHAHIDCIIDARLQLACQTLQLITLWELLTSTKKRINAICVLSTGYPFLSSNQWFTRCRVVSTISIWWMIVRKTKQFAILGSVRPECCPLCTLKAWLVDVEKK
jgi:hypothetical protein